LQIKVKVKVKISPGFIMLQVMIL